MAVGGDTGDLLEAYFTIKNGIYTGLFISAKRNSVFETCLIFTRLMSNLSSNRILLPINTLLWLTLFEY